MFMLIIYREEKYLWSKPWGYLSFNKELHRISDAFFHFQNQYLCQDKFYSQTSYSLMSNGSK